MSGLRAVAALPLLAVGCAADQGEGAAALLQQALASSRASLALAGAGSPATPAAVTPLAAAQRPRPGDAPAAIPPGPRQRGTAPPAAAAALQGSTTDQMRRMLGEPALRRAEGEAEIWLYEAASCRLDIVLYPQGGALVVAHAAARAHGAGAAVTEAACLTEVAGAPTTRPWGEPGRRA